MAETSTTQGLPADERARDRLAPNPLMQERAACGGDRCTATHDAPVLSGLGGSRPRVDRSNWETYDAWARRVDQRREQHQRPT